MTIKETIQKDQQLIDDIKKEVLEKHAGKYSARFEDIMHKAIESLEHKLLILKDTLELGEKAKKTTQTTQD